MTDAEIDDFLTRRAAGGDESDSSAGLPDWMLGTAKRRRLFNVTGPVSVFEMRSPARRYSEEEDDDEIRYANPGELEVEVVGSSDWPDRLE
jgi:hypothetical protein